MIHLFEENGKSFTRKDLKSLFLKSVSDRLINNNGMEEIKIHTDIIFTYTQYDNLYKISFDNIQFCAGYSELHNIITLIQFELPVHEYVND